MAGKCSAEASVKIRNTKGVYKKRSEMQSENRGFDSYFRCVVYRKGSCAVVLVDRVVLHLVPNNINDTEQK